jgi:anaerobic magnesium-protoporphyrin IX monomethyl ester cyclase
MKRDICKILLVFPSMIYKQAQSRKTAIFPLGLGHLAAVLEKDYEVRILDSAMEGFENEVQQENGLNCYGLSDDAFRKIYADYQPDMVGISCLFSSLHRQILRVARLAKEVNPSVINVVGGPHPSALPGLILRNPAIDYCVIGEGEKPLIGLLNRLREDETLADLDGIGFKDKGRIRLNPRLNLVSDLNQLPFPAWHIVDIERYFNIGSVQGLRMDGKKKRGLRLVQVTTSRGCPFSCTFCAKSVIWGNRFRSMSPKRVFEMLEMLLERYHVERIAFQDDNLTANRSRALEIFHGLAERKWPLTWEAHNGLSYLTLDEELLDAMAESGCISFTGAVESASEEVLRKVRKPVNLKRALELARYAKSLGLDIRAFYIIGFPGETSEQIEATRAHLQEMQASVSALALYTPLPGSPLYKDLERKNIINSESLDFEKLSFGAFDIQLSELSVNELHRIRKIDWLRNVFADPKGNIKTALQINPEIILKELKNGLELYPDAPEIRNLYNQALERFGPKGV